MFQSQLFRFRLPPSAGWMLARLELLDEEIRRIIDITQQVRTTLTARREETQQIAAEAGAPGNARPPPSEEAAEAIAAICDGLKARVQRR